MKNIKDNSHKICTLTRYLKIEVQIISVSRTDWLDTVTLTAALRENYQTALVFRVRSLLTAFNLTLNYYPLTSRKKEIGIKTEGQRTEELDLDIKAVVFDRCAGNKTAPNGAKDGSCPQNSCPRNDPLRNCEFFNDVIPASMDAAINEKNFEDMELEIAQNTCNLCK